tara:strand:- start:1013 stop:2338 length:1326 start_codon:yes stop_codon:yes gene_type:complete
MKIGVIGTGYVGLVTGVCFSDAGNEVICYDIDDNKVKTLSNGEVTIYEPTLKTKLKSNLKSGNISFSSDLSRICKDNDILFIAVGTPSKDDGSADLSNLFLVAENIGKGIRDGICVVVKSTVPIGTTIKVKEIIETEIKKKNLEINFDIINNPEFLREGRAVSDFMRPDRIVIGAESKRAFELMERLYEPFSINRSKLICMDILSSEMTKYASNSMLATRISFMNEISQICEVVGANVNHVRNGMGADSRIGYQYLYPSVGYGGSCFPKDLRAISNLAKEYNYETKIINSTIEVNTKQIIHFTDRVISYLSSIKGKNRIGIWGLSFKPETDDIREAPSIYLIKKLLNSDVSISVYDPKAMNNFKSLMNDDRISYKDDKYKAIDGVDCMILLTEWQEFRSPDFRNMKNIMKDPIIFDGRNIYNENHLDSMGFKYFQIGVKNK